jgi:prephenate dehydrogenase
MPVFFFKKITIIALGLIGGSWALALKKRGYRGILTGCSRQPTLDRALAAHAIDEAFVDPAAAVHNADVVILALPVGKIIEIFPRLKAALPKQALVTDVGSTKVAICQRAWTVFGETPLFLGGHPMAGKELTGFVHADPDLFEGARYILTPAADSMMQDARAEAFVSLIRSIGAVPVTTDPATHDQAVAWLSHLPQVVSTAVASVIAEEESRNSMPLDFSATGLRDTTRLAESPYPLWQDILDTNQDNIRTALDRLIAKLENMRRHLGDEGLAADFERASKLRQRLRELGP